MIGIDRPSLWSPVVLGLGIAAYFSLPSEPAPHVVVMLAMASVALLWLGVHSRVAGALPSLASTALALILLGCVLGFLDTARHLSPMLTSQVGPTSVTGKVASRADSRGTPRVILSDVIVDGLPANATPVRVRISASGQNHLEPGQTVTLRAILTPPRPPLMPGAFDFRRYAFFEGYGAVGFAVGTAEIVEDRPATSFANSLEQLRFEIGTRITDALPGRSGAVAKALLTGDRGDISYQTTEALRVAGLAHLLAISGLHVGLVAGMTFFVMRAGMALSTYAALTWPIKKIAAGTALVGCLGYVFLVGAPVPTQRAFIMVFVVLLAVMLDRTAISLRTVSLAALAVLAISPNALLGASFQLSFAAVTALVATYEWVSQRQNWTNGDRGVASHLGRYFGAILLTTIVAGLATLPFSLFHFSRFAPWSVPANAVGVPLTAFWIMPLGMLSLILMPFGGESLPLAAMGWGIDRLIDVASAVSTWPHADIHVPAMPKYGLLLAVGGGLWLCLVSGRQRLLGVPFVLAALITPRLVEPPAILVADDLSLIAVVDDENSALSLSMTRSERFVRNVWLSRLGFDDFVPWPDAGEATDLGSCDDAGCRFRIAGRDVVVAHRPRALAEDCTNAALVVAARPRLGACEGAWLYVNSQMLEERGSLAIYPDDEFGWRVVGARDGTGDRPWALK